jgi:hypothetical protein
METPNVVNNTNPSSDISAFVAEQQKQVSDFSYSRVYLKRLCDDWKHECEETDERRKTRDVQVDVRSLRDSGQLDEDETLIPDRVIDENITREQPPYINYLKNSRRLAIFKSLTNTEQDAQKLELEFTRVMTYTGWEVPLFKELDGSQTHGWDAVEVVYDTSKPANCGIEHVGHDKLFFPRTATDFQACSEVIRAYDVTTIQLQDFVERFRFEASQVNLILSAVNVTKKQNETVRIFKRYKKLSGVVMVSWFSLEHGVSDWLSKPKQHFIGIKKQSQGQGFQDAPVTMYPIFILPYRETEKPRIIDHKGRVFLDENKQEAQTAILSGFVNGLTRASNLYASPAQDSGDGASLKELEDLRIAGGRILNKPVNFWSPPYPDPMVIKALQFMDTANAQETNQVNFAAMNREDSRKTAKEIGVAEQQQQLLNSVQLTLFSTHIRSIVSFCWLIVQSQALQGAIKFLQITQQVPVTNPIDGQAVTDPSTGQPMTQPQTSNDVATISQIYDIRAAGDVDVIQNDETIQKMQSFWPIVATTPIAMPFLAELIRRSFPDIGEKWAGQLEQAPQVMNLLQHLTTILASVLKDNPEVYAKLPMDQRNSLAQMITQSMQLTQPQQPAK